MSRMHVHDVRCDDLGLRPNYRGEHHDRHNKRNVCLRLLRYVGRQPKTVQAQRLASGKRQTVPSALCWLNLTLLFIVPCDELTDHRNI